jgi:DNA repair protein RadC
LEEFGFEELSKVDTFRLEQAGLSTKAAIALRAAFHFAERLQMQRLSQPEERPTINSPADAAALVQYEMSGLEREHLRVMLLDTRNHVLDIVEIYRGSVNSSAVRVGEVFVPALRRMAPAIIMIHNHPSQDPTPSPDDVIVTRSVVQAGKILDIDVLDHLVIGGSRWVSLKERGLGFS